MRRLRVVLSVVVLFLALLERRGRAEEPAIAGMRLGNGLKVVIAQDHRAPFVTIHVRYDVGSRDEASHQHGIAHLTEHLAFQSTRHVADGTFIRRLEGAGAIELNGVTQIDSTAFYEVVPVNALDLALWLESERMGFLAEAITPETLRRETEIVNRERAQKHHYGLAATFMPALYPPGHPYHAVHGESADALAHLSVDDVRAFVRRFYAPNNAIVIIAGDVLPSRVAPRVRRWFETLPGGKPVARDPAPPLLPMSYARSVRLDVTGGVAYPTVVLAWRTPAHFMPGDAELDVLARIVCGVLQSEIAKAPSKVRRVACAQQSFELGSVFTIQLVLGASGTPADATAVADGVLESISRADLPPELVSWPNASLRSQQLFAMESLGTRASFMADYTRKVGRPNFFAQDLARYDEVTPATLRAMARKALRLQGRVVLVAQPAAGASELDLGEP